MPVDLCGLTDAELAGLCDGAILEKRRRRRDERRRTLTAIIAALRGFGLEAPEFCVHLGTKRHRCDGPHVGYRQFQAEDFVDDGYMLMSAWPGDDNSDDATREALIVRVRLALGRQGVPTWTDGAGLVVMAYATCDAGGEVEVLTA